MRQVTGIIPKVGKRTDPMLALTVRLIELEMRTTDLTFADIERACGVSRSTLRAWVRGDTKTPHAVTMQFVLRAMGYQTQITDNDGVFVEL